MTLTKENPFNTSDAVLKGDFYGRKKEIETIKDFLESKEQLILLHGQRRIGKTSLLLKIKEIVSSSETDKAVFFDLQNKAKMDMTQVLFELAAKINTELDNPITINKNDFSTDDPIHYFKCSFLPGIFRAIPHGCRIVLLFDEFDSLGDMEEIIIPLMTNIAYHRFKDFLTEIKKGEFPVKFICAVGRNYKDLDENRFGEVLKSSHLLELSYFPREEFDELIKASDAVLPFQPEASERIYALTSGHPFFTQCLAASLFDTAIKRKLTSISPTLISEQLELTLKKLSGGLQWLWKSFQPAERVILFLMAILEEEKNSVNYKSIKEKASEFKWLPAAHDLGNILDRLTNIKLIRRISQPEESYHFYAEFFRKWILLENTREKVGMLLNDIYPETKYYLVNGQFHYNRDEFVQAREFFLKVIEKFPYHYESMCYLGKISIILGKDDETHLDKAVEWFSKAYRQDQYGTKQEYLDALFLKLNRMDEKGEDVDDILLEINRVNPPDHKTTTRLVERFIIQNKEIYDIDGLSKVESLSLKGKNLDHLPGYIQMFEGLKKIDLSNNSIRDLSWVIPLKNLVELDLSGNQIEDITPLQTLSNLETVVLSYNLISDISPLGNINALKFAYIDHNKLSDISSLLKLKGLRQVDLTGNQISLLPPSIIGTGLNVKWTFKPGSDGIFIGDNPIESPPVEILKKGDAAVTDYFKYLEQSAVSLFETKLIIVGSGDVGKTTLMKKLKDNAFKVEPGKEDTTRGIDIQPWQLSCTFPDGLSHEVKIHFWDFGGQDILHATHQFFLTKRSLYLLVWDPRKEEETRSFDYWLNAVKLFGAGSPLIMVMNKADLRIKHIDEASFQDKFPNIAQFLQVSCLTGYHIPELTETIRKAIAGMPHLLDKLPKRWLEIRDELKARPENYISLEDYFTVCRAHQMEQEKALFLSDYLHDLGIILHFRQDPVLAETVILKPGWATGAVYALIDSLEIQRNKGRFNRSQLGRYWDKNKYPAEKYPQLLRLIEKFELCFNIVGTDEYILPELLPSQRPAIDTEAYRSPGCLHLHFAYDFMPAGIVTRFISRLYYLIRADHYWKNGVELAFSGATALVVSDEARKRIRVSVSGTDNSQLMGVIRSHFDHIHETLNMKKGQHVFEEIPCNCPQCLASNEPHFFKYHVLQKFLSKGREIPCEKSAEDVFIPQLLHGLVISQEPADIFDTLVTIAAQIQGIRKTLQKDENSRNTVVALLLQTRGFRVKDQTLWGVSAAGTRPCEVDIKIEDETGRTSAIIEACNLDAFNSQVIEYNIKRLLDSGCISNNYLLVYSQATKFPDLWKKHLVHLLECDAELKIIEAPKELDTGFVGIKAASSLHLVSEREVTINHIFIDMGGSR